MKAAGITPSKVEYDVGKNSVGQPVTLTKEGERWLLKRHPANQRDDSYGMYLTVDLNDSAANGLPSSRDAIDKRMRETAEKAA